jgi:hypothetical protein
VLLRTTQFTVNNFVRTSFLPTHIVAPVVQHRNYVLKKKKIGTKKVKKAAKVADDFSVVDEAPKSTESVVEAPKKKVLKKKTKLVKKKRPIDVTNPDNIRKLEKRFDVDSDEKQKKQELEPKIVRRMKAQLEQDDIDLLEGASEHTIKRVLKKKIQKETPEEHRGSKLTRQQMTEVKEKLKTILEQDKLESEQDAKEGLKIRRVSPIVQLAKEYRIPAKSIVRIVKSKSFEADEKTEQKLAKRDEKRKSEQAESKLFKRDKSTRRPFNQFDRRPRHESRNVDANSLGERSFARLTERGRSEEEPKRFTRFEERPRSRSSEPRREEGRSFRAQPPRNNELEDKFDRPRERRAGSASYFNEREGRSFGEDRSRSRSSGFNNDRPRFNEDRPRFNDREDRPRFNRDENNDRPRFRDGNDRPRFNRDGNSDRPRFSRDGNNNDRPRFNRDGNNDRPRFNRDDRPQRSFRDERSTNSTFNADRRSAGRNSDAPMSKKPDAEALERLASDYKVELPSSRPKKFTRRN